MSRLAGVAGPTRTGRRPRPADVTGPPGRGDGTLLTVMPPARAGDPRLAIVGYLLSPGPLPRTGQAPGPAGPLPAALPGGLVIDREQYRVTAGGRDLGLVYQEFELLAFLASYPNHALTRDEILAGAWPGRVLADGLADTTRTVDIHIHRLRRKLGPGHARCLVTVRRVGYMFRPPGGS
jgi:hypothetical protein